MFGFFKRKKPLEPRARLDAKLMYDQLLENRLVEIHELKPDKRYLFWFDEPQPPYRIISLRRGLEDAGINGLIVTGAQMEIFEFEANKDGTQHNQAVEPQNQGTGLESGDGRDEGR